MRKILRWYLILLLLAAVCILGAWAVSSRSREPANATLVRNIPGNYSGQYSYHSESRGWDIGTDVGIQN